MNEKSKLTIQLPAAGLNSYSQKNVQTLGANSKWKLSDPTSTADLNCYVVAVGVPEIQTTQANSCSNLGGTVLASPHVFAGGFAAGTTQEIEVQSGNNRSIYLFGFKTDSAIGCSELTKSKFNALNFSAPFLVGQKVVDLIPGDNEVVLSVATNLVSTSKFEECSPFLFSNDKVPAPPTAIVTSTPNSYSNVIALNIDVSGVGVVDYQYSIIGGATDCSNANYGSFINESVNITESISPKPDGNITLCVIARNSAAIAQTTPTSYTWLKDTVAPTSMSNLSTRTTGISKYYSPIYYWDASSDAGSGISHYEVALGTSPNGTDIMNWTSYQLSYLNNLNLTDATTYYYAIRAVDRAGNISTAIPSGFQVDLTPNWVQQSHIKAENAGSNDFHGESIALDGDYLVAGAPGEDNNFTGVLNGSTISENNSADVTGAAYVYKRTGTAWSRMAYLKASDAVSGDRFGAAVAISGQHIAVAAPNRSSTQGGVYIFKLDPTTNQWAEQQILTAPNGITGTYFGSAVALHKDIVVVGSPYEGSSVPGVSTIPSSDTSAPGSGAAYVYKRGSSSWSFSAYLKPPIVHNLANFGAAVSVHNNTIVVGAVNDATIASTISNDSTAPNNNSGLYRGSVYVFVANALGWEQQAFIKPSNNGDNDRFGSSVAVFEDTIIAGAPGEASSETNVINGAAASADDSMSGAGAAYAFTRNAGTWTQSAYFKASNAASSDNFGSSVAIFGSTVVVGARLEDASDTSVTIGSGSSSNNSMSGSGAAYAYQRIGSTWTQEAYLKPPNTAINMHFGDNVCISGSTIALGVRDEASSGNSITNSTTAPTSSGSAASGAVYIFDP